MTVPPPNLLIGWAAKCLWFFFLFKNGLLIWWIPATAFSLVST